MGKNDCSKRLDSIWKRCLEKGECPYGCSVVDKTCEHLEAYLEPEKNISVKAEPRDPDQIDRLQERNTYYVPPTEERARQLAQQMKSYGLADWEITVVIERYIYDLTYKEIQEKYHWTNITYVHRICKQAILKLEERGFTPRRN